MARKRLTDEEIVIALIAQGSIKQAAASLHCTVKTLYNRMKEPDFKRIYTDAKADLLKTATAKLQGNLCTAIDTLTAIMTDPETAKQTRANCAVSILQYAGRFTETTDLIERLEALEEAQEKSTSYF
jgi:hypothetical protein